MEFQADEFLILLMRWIHFVSGVTWIGLLYYFNIVQAPFMKETDAGTKSGVVQKLGGGLGIIMFLNVWLLIWPNQKVVIRMTTEAAASKTSPSPEMAKHARIAFLASRTNFFLSFPMLFFMATASHYPLF